MRNAAAVSLASIALTFAGVARAEAPEHVVAPEAAVLVAYRAGSSSTGYPVEDRWRGGFRAGGAWSMWRGFTLGLFYERVGAGRERVSYPDAGYASDTSRSLHAVLADLRVFPLITDAARLFLELDAGFSLEAVEQSGYYRPAAYRCTASSTASVALGVAAGGEIELGHGVALIGRAFATVHRLGSDPLADADALPCAPGAGTINLLGATLGLGYRFDLGK